MNKTVVVITGPVGVGKTSVINSIKIDLEKTERSQDNISIDVIKEYIDVLKDGEIMLEKYLNKEISTITFQEYIMKYYEEYISKYNSDIIIMERCPDDAVSIFCKKDLNNGKLSEEDYKKIKDISGSISVKNGIPSYFKLNNSLFFKVKSDDVNKCSSICSDIIRRCRSEGINRVIIGLYESADVCYERIKKRNRYGEDNYKIEDIEVINRLYDDLYNNLNI